MLQKFIRKSLFPGYPYRWANYLLSDHTQLTDGNLTLKKVDTPENMWVDYKIVIMWDGKIVYEATHYNTVKRFHYGKTWYDELYQWYTDIESKNIRAQQAKFTDLGE